MKKQPQRIQNQEELDMLLQENKKNNAYLECFIQLNFGVRSSKDILLDDDGNYFVINEIDGSEETIKHNELAKTFLGEALSKGALYKY